jgi:site-specific recombinase XerD
MRDQSALGPWVRRFLLEHLVAERNLAKNTQYSYRDTMALLAPFASSTAKTAIHELAVEDLSGDLIRAFLKHLESARSCSVRTRNQRLAAIHALAKFVGERSPQHIEWCGTVRSIPFKRTENNPVSYLDKVEIDTILAAPDRQTAQGRRDYAILLFLYNSGARVSEAAGVRVGDLERDSTGTGVVRLHGKGNKTRFCPLWASTMIELRHLVNGRQGDVALFLNRYGAAIGRFGIHAVVERHAQTAKARLPSLKAKRVSPHTIRHTTATHLLRAGVDINTVRAWLGHVSVDTTNIYAETDLETKARALAACEVGPGPNRKPGGWKSDRDLLEFLRSL